MLSWAAQELQSAELGDTRLKQRLIKIVENLAAQPNTSIPQASQTWAETKATYRFWSSEKVKAEDIIEAHQISVVERAQAHQWLLAIQDTTDLNFTAHKSKTPAAGFGWLSSQDYLLGLKVHTVFGVSDSGVPLGILHQPVWARKPSEKGKAKERKHKLIGQKESKRWLTGVVATELGLPESLGVVTIADGEADIYELLTLERNPNSHLLLRATHNRQVDHESGCSQSSSCGWATAIRTAS
jgi:hypothetical protein